MAEHEAADAAGPRTQGNPDRDLAGASGHEVMEHGARGSQDQRREGEAGEKRAREAPGRERAVTRFARAAHGLRQELTT